MIGTGLDCLPQSQVLQECYGQGLVISEYKGEPPVAYHFPERNRIIAGLSEVVLVVEARKGVGV